MYRSALGAMQRHALDTPAIARLAALSVLPHPAQDTKRSRAVASILASTLALLLAFAVLGAGSLAAETGYVTVSDGTRLYYEAEGQGKPILLMHGWSGSNRFFDKNFAALAQQFRVYRIDIRGHGDSDKPENGYTMLRYAKDLHDFLKAENLDDVTVVGWSMGASILWGYYQLFGDDRISKMVFVDQAPAQYMAPDWHYPQPGCYDQAALERLHARLLYDEKGAAMALVEGCRPEGVETSAADMDFLVGEVMKTPARVKYWAMRDHTNHDWRRQLARIDLPVVMAIGRKSKMFDWRGTKQGCDILPRCTAVYFEESGHMPFWEEPRKFNRMLTELVNGDPD